MGQLPQDRLMPYVRHFSYTGIDYCESFYVAAGRRREKRQIALFTCLLKFEAATGLILSERKRN